MTTIKAKVNARLFRVAAAFVSTDTTRYYLQGVAIQPHPVKGVFLVATDGHRMMIIHDDKGEINGANLIVKLDKAALTACKTARRETDKAVLIEGDNASITYNGVPVAMSYSVLIDRTFPEWQRIARPNTDDEFNGVCFNGAYLAAFAKAADELREIKGAGVIIGGNASNPNLIRFNEVNYAYGVLMPLRSATVHEVPAFMDQKPETSATPIAA